MCMYKREIEEIATAFMEEKKSFGAKEIKDAVEVRVKEKPYVGYFVRYRETLHELLTFVQRNGIAFSYIARTKTVTAEDNNTYQVWEFVHYPAAYRTGIKRLLNLFC